MIKRSTILFMLLCGQAQAIPFVDGDASHLSLGSPGQEAITMLRDSEDHNLFHVPYNRLGIVYDKEGYPDFGFSYHPKGALISFTVKPDIDWPAFEQSRQKILEENPQAQFKLVDVRSGSYSLTIRTQDGDEVFEAGTPLVESSLGNPWSVAIHFNKDQGDLLVTALQTGAILGVNYHYDFEAETFPSVAMVRFDREMFIENASQKLIHSQKTISEELQVLRRDEGLKVFTSGPDVPWDFILSYLSSLGRDSCFVSTLPQSPFVGYTVDPESCHKNMIEELTVKSDASFAFKAAVGFSIGSLCNEYPDLFVFRSHDRKIHSGCPDRIIPENPSQSSPSTLNYEQDPSLPFWPSVVFSY